MIYMILEISCSILKKKKNLQFLLSLTSNFFGIFFGLKTPKNYKSCPKSGPNHQFTLLSFTFHQINQIFDVDLFSRTFDMESPLYVICSVSHVF